MNYSSYWQVIKSTVSMSQQQAVEYRVDYLLRVLRALIDIFVIVVVLASFYGQADEIMGWTKWEAMVVFGFFQFISSGVFFFFGYGINELPNNIIRGRLDQFLTKPLSGQFLASTKFIFLTNAFRSVFGLGVLVYGVLRAGYVPTLVDIASSTVALFSSLIVYYAVSFSISAISFWSSSSEQIYMWDTIASTSRFPADFYQRGMRWLLYLLPLVFFATVPAEALLGKSHVLSWLSPIVALASIWVVRKIWDLGLRSYQSASS
jgi:ABC-2 type transport system permease protein